MGKVDISCDGNVVIDNNIIKKLGIIWENEFSSEIPLP